MATIGRVVEIWRYPVKSMLGENLERCAVGPLGIPGDRGYALRDEASREMCGAKKFPALMQCRARYRKEPGPDEIPPVDLAFPDGIHTASDAEERDTVLSAFVGKAVTLWPRQPADDREHYRRRVQRDEPALRSLLGLEPDEPFPDFSLLPPDLLENLRDFTSPLGTYFDAYPIHFVTTSWLRELSRHNAESRFEAPRFRPNFLIESRDADSHEREWTGRPLRIGEVELRCACPTVRCSMTVQATGDLPKDPQVLRTLVRESGQFLGTYASVEREGKIEVGDSVELL